MASSKALLAILLIAFANGSQSAMNFGGTGYSMQMGGNGVTIKKYTDETRVVVESSDIREDISGISTTSSNIIENRMVIGSHGDSKMVWSNTSDSLTIIENDKCIQQWYKEHVRLSSEPMSSEDCADVKENIEGMNEEITTMLAAFKNGIFNEYSGLSYSLSNNGESYSNNPAGVTLSHFGNTYNYGTDDNDDDDENDDNNGYGQTTFNYYHNEDSEDQESYVTSDISEEDDYESEEEESDEAENYQESPSRSVTKGFNFGGDGYSMQIAGNGYSIKKYTNENRIVVETKDIYEDISGINYASSYMIGNLVHIGTDKKSMWSENSNELVIIENNKMCTKRIYKQHVRISSETMSTADCAKVMEKVKQMKKDSETMFADLKRGNFKKYSGISYSINSNGMSFSNNPAGTTMTNFGNTYNYGPEASNAASNNGYNYNYNYNPAGSTISGFGNTYNGGSNKPSGNKPSASNKPSGSNKPSANNNPFGNNWPFGPNNNPFVSSSTNSGNSGRRNSRRQTPRRVAYQPNVANYFNN